MVRKRETKQKKIIQDYILKTKTFFTTDEIHKKINKDFRKIGIATIYRFLKEMEKNREIHAFTCDRKKIYSKNGMSHSHFSCESCGSIRHIAIEKIDFLKKYIGEDICHVQIEISGVCDDCKKKSNK